MPLLKIKYLIFQYSIRTKLRINISNFPGNLQVFWEFPNSREQLYSGELSTLVINKNARGTKLNRISSKQKFSTVTTLVCSDRFLYTRNIFYKKQVIFLPR